MRYRAINVISNSAAITPGDSVGLVSLAGDAAHIVAAYLGTVPKWAHNRIFKNAAFGEAGQIVQNERNAEADFLR